MNRIDRGACPACNAFCRGRSEFFDSGAGTTFGLVGESGCGKSTLARHGGRASCRRVQRPAFCYRRHRPITAPRSRAARASGAAHAASNGLSRPLCQRQSALAGGGHYRRAHPKNRSRRQARTRRQRVADLLTKVGLAPAGRCKNSRTNSPAASVSASRSRARSQVSRSFSCVTSRPRRWTFRCRRRSSI